MYFSTYSSPVGTLLLRSDGRALTHLTFAGDPQACGEPDRITEQAAQWLDRYFRGEDPAVGSNPVSILIPCHRVVGAGGKLTGYAWGTEKKQWLLQHEKENRYDD